MNRTTDWIRWGQWVQPTLSGSYWDDWSQSSTFPFDLNSVTGALPVLDGHFFLPKEDHDTIYAFLADHEGDFTLLKVMEQWVYDVHDRCLRDTQRHHQDTKAAMLTLKARYNDVGNPWLFFGYYVDQWLMQRLPDLTNNVEAFVASVHPLHDPIVVQQAREAKALRARAGDARTLVDVTPALREEILQHVARFKFCGIHHFVGAPYSVQKFFTHPLPPENNTETSCSEDLSWHHKLACLAAWARTFMAETSGLLAYAFRPELRKAEHILGMDFGDILWLHIDEILRGLDDPHTFVIPDIEERKRGVGIISRGDDVVILTGDALNTALKDVLPKREGSLPLRGMPASPGHATGVVKLVLQPKDVYKVQKGDILVANETSPDFFPAMQKAAAIVTDLGGLTTHAAIVSRELGIPCVVGTLYGTIALEDGDHVFVDADVGIVDLVKSSRL